MSLIMPRTTIIMPHFTSVLSTIADGIGPYWRATQQPSLNAAQSSILTARNPRPTSTVRRDAHLMSLRLRR